jgi:hypothetical protein
VYWGCYDRPASVFGVAFEGFRRLAGGRLDFEAPGGAAVDGRMCADVHAALQVGVAQPRVGGLFSGRDGLGAFENPVRAGGRPAERAARSCSESADRRKLPRPIDGRSPGEF